MYTVQPRAVHRMFIQVEKTPNVHSLKFLPGKPVVPSGRSYEFTNASASTTNASSPLARKLMSIPGVKSVLLGPDFISVNKHDDNEWGIIKPDIFASIMDFYQANLPLINENPVDPSSGRGAENTEPESETVLMIKELLESRIRPAVQEDGGDIEFIRFSDDGVVYLKLQGSCRGCASSSVTLKSGIQNMLQHYIPEVKSVEQVLDEAEKVSEEEFKKLERTLNGNSHDSSVSNRGT